jgi:hypothetical protein
VCAAPQAATRAREEAEAEVAWLSHEQQRLQHRVVVLEAELAAARASTVDVARRGGSGGGGKMLMLMPPPERAMVTVRAAASACVSPALCRPRWKTPSGRHGA